MRDVTEAELLGWKQLPLFRNCGNPLSGLAGVRQVSRLKAVNSLKNLFGTWFSFGLMLGNRTNYMASLQNHERASTWNEVVSEITVDCDYLSKLAQQSAALPDEKEIFYSIRACLIEALMEIEFSDVTPSIFYEKRLRPILLAGNLPCGWDGPKLDTSWAGASTDPVPEGTVLYY
jgi:hypothetical protein